MKKSGFSMIELIFVIVIIGILSAVALPKFVGMSSQAHTGNLSDFQGVLNRTVAPTVWGKVAANGQGDLGKLSSGDQNLSIYTAVPKEFTSNSSKDANLSDKSSTNSNTITDVEGNTISKCPTDGGNKYDLLQAGSSDKFEAKVGKATYGVVWCNGSASVAPKYYIYKE